jgi:Uncharacterised nucleotidyltransferase
VRSSSQATDRICSAYRFQLLQNAVREHEICSAFQMLRSVGVEPVLLKGWSVGRLYPDSAGRCLGDIDLLIGDEQLPIAEEKLHDLALNVDWHKLSSLKAEFAEPEEVVRRSGLVPLSNARIRVLCDEDNLHFVAIHMLRHGGWSPVWMRDVAVLLGCRLASFDWDVCLGPDTTRAGWVLSALLLAHKLAGADISGTPVEQHKVPEWLEPAVVRAQQTPEPEDNQPPESIWTALAHPWRLPDALRKRWPNPITAAVITGSPFENRSPCAHQLRYCTHLAANFLSRTF